jgi:hypothetical protein
MTFFVDRFDEFARFINLLGEETEFSTAYEDSDHPVVHVVLGAAEGSEDLEYKTYERPMELIYDLPLRSARGPDLKIEVVS